MARCSYRLTFIMGVLCWLNCFGQIKQEIRGKVVDRESKIPLAGATIKLFNSTTDVISDTNGNFHLTVSVGRISINVSYVGYEDLVIQALEVIAGKAFFLTIELTENITTQH